MTLEVCVSSVQGALAARDGGAQRIELCSALEVGGITPSVGLMKEVRAIPDLAMHVLIRPRGGDFLYDDSEIRCMEEDIRQAIACGADGVVIGALTSDGDIDKNTCKRLIEAAKGKNVTFHRAFDVCSHPLQALEEIIELGCNRLLTSGQASKAIFGIPLLKELSNVAHGRIFIMPGCGVNAHNAFQILSETNTNEIHASASNFVDSMMKFRHMGINMGNQGQDEYSRKETCFEEVRAIVQAINPIV